MADVGAQDARDDDDAGMTLVELIVYMGLLIMVIVMVGSIFIAGKKVERDANSMANASNTAQLAARQIEWPLRNALTVQVDTVQFGGDLLVTKTRVDGATDSTNAATWKCVAFFYDRTSEAIYSITGSATGTPVTSGLTPGFSLSGWKEVVRGVVPHNSQPIFVTTGIGGGAVLEFDALTSRDTAPVNIRTSAIPRIQGSDGTSFGGEACGDYS